MRIISGEYKSRKILSGTGSKDFRPSSDRTRETVFNILSHRIEIPEKKCLDLFAGTGGYGFEALSRGAGACTFVESSPKRISFIRKTAGALGCTDRTEIVRLDAIEYLQKDKNSQFDIILADPPYDYDSYDELIRLVLFRNFEVFVIEYSKEIQKKINAIDARGANQIIDKNIGGTCVRIFFHV